MTAGILRMPLLSRQLGYSEASMALLGVEEAKAMLLFVECTGDEDTVGLSKRGLGLSNCNLGEEAGVVCVDGLQCVDDGQCEWPSLSRWSLRINADGECLNTESRPGFTCQAEVCVRRPCAGDRPLR